MIPFIRQSNVTMLLPPPVSSGLKHTYMCMLHPVLVIGITEKPTANHNMLVCWEGS